MRIRDKDIHRGDDRSRDIMMTGDGAKRCAINTTLDKQTTTIITRTSSFRQVDSAALNLKIKFTRFESLESFRKL